MNNKSYGEAPLSTSWRGAGGEGASVLIFGAGKSATCLIDYMINEAGINGWLVTIADHDLALAQSKTGQHKYATAVSINVENVAARNELIQAASIVISLLPPALHFLVAQDCVLFGKNLLTASYTGDQIKNLQPAIEEKNLLFLCEMGLDPGIDHMSAMQLIDTIKAEGGTITSFISHCGGLVAPESDNNPWHYKISWNPRNVVMAGKAGAGYLENREVRNKKYEDLFNHERVINFPGIGALAWYPNRDSLDYIKVYQLDGIDTFIRTTLRYAAFSYGWKKIVELKLTADDIFYETEGMSLQDFFKQHFDQQGFTESIQQTANQDNAFYQQLLYLGINDGDTIINNGRCSAMDALQFALEKKLVLKEQDKDMIVMLHEIDYSKNDKKYRTSSSLLVKGDDNLRTAMAKTVGLPLGIAAKLILQGKIKEKGLHIPVIPAIYEPVLAGLRQHGIIFHESTVAL